MNRVCIVARLVRDPELRDVNGTSICGMRVAYNTRRKVDGEWTEVGNFCNVTAFGKLGDLCAQYLAKGREAAFDGRLEIREYESNGEKRISVDIIADNVRFVGGKDSGSGGGASNDAAADDDIPF
jgi:single-strand DNA-binding protein